MNRNVKVLGEIASLTPVQEKTNILTELTSPDAMQWSTTKEEVMPF